MHQIFLGVLRARLWIVAVFVLLTAAGIYGALKIPTDSAIDRLIVPGDPISQATDEFEKVFPEGEQALLMLESPDPLSLGSLRSAADLERQLAKIPHVEPHSLLTLFSRGNSSGVRDVIVAGRTIVKDGVVAGVDLRQIEAELKRCYKINRSRYCRLEDSWLTIETAISRWFTDFLGCS